MEQVINLLIDQVKNLRMENKYDVKEMRDSSNNLKKEISDINVKLSVIENDLKAIKEQKPLISLPNSAQGWIKIILLLAATGIIPSGIVNAAVKVISDDISIDQSPITTSVVREGE
jgi:hypothetical protein